MTFTLNMEIIKLHVVCANVMGTHYMMHQDGIQICNISSMILFGQIFETRFAVIAFCFYHPIAIHSQLRWSRCCFSRRSALVSKTQ